MKEEKESFLIQEMIWVKVCGLKEHEGFPLYLVHSSFPYACLLSRNTMNIRIKKAKIICGQWIPFMVLILYPSTPVAMPLCHATFGNLPVQTQVSQSMNFFDRMLANVTQAETWKVLAELSLLALISLSLLWECVWASLLERCERHIKQNRIALADTWGSLATTST